MKDCPDLKVLLQCAKTLALDADECYREMERAQSALSKRNYVRAVFAWSEALSYLFRQTAFQKLAEEALTVEAIPRLLALQEKNYTLNDKGEIVSTRLKASTSSILLFSLKAFSESQGLLLEVDKGGPNWQAYTNALKIRDRITHPKTPADVDLSDKDIKVVGEAKGMILGYLEVVLNPELISVINAHREIAIKEGKEITLTFTEEEKPSLKLKGPNNAFWR
jgi:hypothetical protein